MIRKEHTRDVPFQHTEDPFTSFCCCDDPFIPPMEEEDYVAEILLGDSEPGYAEDNWAHRSSNMHCRTCMWYAPKIDSLHQESEIGRCRRHAPTMNGFPVVFFTDWCGDHKLDEEKI